MAASQEINIPRLIKWLEVHADMAAQSNLHTYAVRMSEAARLIREMQEKWDRV